MGHRFRTAFSALALWLGVIWVAASLPGAAAARPWDLHDRPAAEAAGRDWPEQDWPEQDWPEQDWPEQDWPEQDWPEQDRPLQDWPVQGWPVQEWPEQEWREHEPPEPAAATVGEVADWVVASRDNGSLPFVIIDKVAAEVFVFGADGRLRGAAPALLGLAHGDDSAPGVGDREMSAILPEERTTPAGRFLAGYGPALGGKSVIWVDYPTAISLHPVVSNNPREQRLQRLESPSPEDNRITYGCINVSADFYEDVVRPAFTGTLGVVYILPEATPLDAVLPAFQARADAAYARPDQRGAGLAAHRGLAPD